MTPTQTDSDSLTIVGVEHALRAREGVLTLTYHHHHSVYAAVVETPGSTSSGYHESLTVAIMRALAGNREERAPSRAERTRALAEDAEVLVPMGWTLEGFMLGSGVIKWVHPTHPSFAATPGWGDCEGIAIEIDEDVSLSPEDREIFDRDVLPSGGDWSIETLTPAKYVELLAPHFAALARAL